MLHYYIFFTGIVGGRFLKRRKEKVTELELQKLSRSNSLPDVKGEPGSDNSWFGWGRKRNQSTAAIDDAGT